MAFTTTESGAMIITGEEDTNLARLMTLKAALGLEVKGLKASRGWSAFKTVKREFNLKGTKQNVLEKFTAIVEAKKAARLVSAQ